MSGVKTAIIKLGPLTIHWYGIIVALALVVGLLISVGMARLRGRRADPLAGILLLGLLAGLIGARIWYFVFRHDYYNPDPGRVFAVWQGGLALHGALAGAILATVIYTWSRRLDFWTWADICVPGLILAQAIGRVGDVVNNQAFGIPTTGPWAVTIPLENRPPQYVGYSQFTPTASYEILWDVVVFVVLMGLTLLQSRRVRLVPSGSIFATYLVLYSVGRIPLEGLRVDSLWVANMRVAQIASWILIAAGGLLYVIRLLPRREVTPIEVPALQIQPTEAYLIAAQRSSRSLRDGDQAQEYRFPEQPAYTANGHGRLPPTQPMPALPGPAVEHVTGQPTGGPTEEAS